MKSKYKKCKTKDLKDLSNISNAFCFDTQFDFHADNRNNYKSIFSYKAIEINDDDEETEEKSYYAITIILGFLMVLFFPVFGWFSFKIVRRNYKLAVFRYGKLLKIINPGITFVIPLIDSCKYIDTTMKDCHVKNASCPTKDHGLVEIDCSIKYRIIDPTYMIINVKNWSDFIITETRVALLLALKHFRWTDFNESRISSDLENQILRVLNTKVEEKGLEICGAHVENITQGREPESPMDVLKKINFKDLGRQLTSMTPLFMNSTQNNSENIDNEKNSKEKAVKDFFDKLEIIKNIALNKITQQKETEKSVIINDSPHAEAQFLLEKLIRNFVRYNITNAEISRILFEKSIKPLFENTKKVIELSNGIKEILKTYNIQGNILFDLTGFFKYASHFHYNYKNETLIAETTDDHVLMITLRNS